MYDMTKKQNIAKGKQFLVIIGTKTGGMSVVEAFTFSLLGMKPRTTIEV
jgi:hypothetical protein